jgi:hypothetical protein
MNYRQLIIALLYHPINLNDEIIIKMRENTDRQATYLFDIEPEIDDDGVLVLQEKNGHSS